GAGPLRQLEAGIGQVGHRDVAGADVAGDGGGHDADRAGAGDDDVLPGEGEGEGRVHGIAQRVEDRSEVGVDPVVVDPGIGRGDDDVVGEGAVPVHPDADRVDAQVPAACPAVATGAAHEVPLTGDAVTDGDVGDRRPDLVDLAVELVADHLGRPGDRAGRPLVPPVEVEIGAAETGPQHADPHLVGGGVWFGDIRQLQA